MKKIRNIVRLLAVLLIVIGSIYTVQVCNKVVVTGLQLIVLRDNASYYNEQYFKTDEMTEAYNQNHAKRQELYNSEDSIVRGYSNLGSITKALAWIAAVMMYPGICLVWLYIIMNVIFKLERTFKRRRRQRQRRS